ncbi:MULTISPECIES: cytochrome c-550 PedF [unclassified Methylobacterium]|uniref:cytochrome c-550 PedF n=1 Tax=unclassified Methylobacterium TaxID=2615210 RepID=UPI0006F5A28B|nr:MULTISPECIES: cytochrome c-550 PedF [unclassified Methylobacterium]KQO70659.1 cytochrome c-550 PedF [Methylobacterium sp. Leaf88]MCJ2037087.1 cytochrome c-550 PedF [Methylobacterium sp. J-068]
MKPVILGGGLLALGLALSASMAFGHGDVQPQPVDTAGLAPLGEGWKEENPYRGNAKAIAIGDSGFNQNCARCHGLQVISGGLAPDLRYLPVGKEGDEYFVERVRHGAIINGMTKMPAFEGVLSQEALWAIRTYIESKHEE